MKAKLQKQLAYKYKEKKHYKHVIVVPDEAITELGWKGGQELELLVKGRQLIAHISAEVKKETNQKGDNSS
jgi:bifunctional DNA-binding transcriptional regulator/antitoxin component of YhaV-PrlF toxin-antitoxin module